jgi:hypothetical protein
MVRLHQGEFSEVEEKVALNQTHSPERVEKVDAYVDPFVLGADETPRIAMVRIEGDSRGLRLHRAERTENGATRRVTGIERSS